MHLVVINCSPRTVAKSNTNFILKQFIKGYTEDGNTAELYHLSQRNTWKEIKRAYSENDNILMAIPLFVECIPGLMIEFLEQLSRKQGKTKISFLLQGGFDEASQLRCCESYLEQLPSHLGCEYGGTLIKGGMFITNLMDEQIQQKKLHPFYLAGQDFARDGIFTKEKSDLFAGNEYSSKMEILIFTVLSPFVKQFMGSFFKKHGCVGKLSAKPYEKYLTNNK